MPMLDKFFGLLILSVPFTELNVQCWSELTRRKLSPMLATAHHSGPDSAIAQCELSGYVKLGWLLEAVQQIFSHRSGNPAVALVMQTCWLALQLIVKIDLLRVVARRFVCNQNTSIMTWCMVVKYAGVNVIRIYCTFSVYNCLQLE